MRRGTKSQFRGPGIPGPAPVTRELIVPNPKLKLLDQVKEVMRLRHYSIRTEQCYCDWIRRYIKFHGMRSREELLLGTGKVETFLSDLAARKRDLEIFHRCEKNGHFNRERNSRHEWHEFPNLSHEEREETKGRWNDEGRRTKSEGNRKSENGTPEF
jgi:hypothetical protein